jgi:UDP-N-acetyl-D-mannosaminuronic acid transferase (WecB/TagA/CpsF family)
MQAVGMEWLFRLAQEPRRLFSRYLRDLGWLAVIAASTLRERWNRHATSSVG